jgi:hypothetical protein
MIGKVSTRWLLLTISLLSLCLILPCGCKDKSQAERNNALMESLEKEGVGDPANRDKYNNEEYRKGYDAGYKNGYSEGRGDYQRGEDFTPSAMGVKTGSGMYDRGFRTGNLDGYYDAYEDCMRIAEEAEQLAASGEKASGEEASEDDEETRDQEERSDYDQGYGVGRMWGLEDGKYHRENAFEYHPLYDHLHAEEISGSDEYKRGIKDGYYAGYDEAYKGP